MLPSTATPRAPPTSRLVSLTAEPTPALASGMDSMTAPVAGAVVMAMPAAQEHQADGQMDVAASRRSGTTW